MEITHLDQAGLNLLKDFEEFRSEPYRDSVGIPTIGYGFTWYPLTGKKVTMADAPIPRAIADGDLLVLLHPFEQCVYSTTRDDLTKNQFNALVCLTYNIGTNGFRSSTVHRLVNGGDNGSYALQTAWYAWDKGGGVVLPGLLNRRKREYAVFVS